jgi:hypothetical protein
MFRQQLPKSHGLVIARTHLVRISMYACAGWVFGDQSLANETKPAHARVWEIGSG